MTTLRHELVFSQLMKIAAPSTSVVFSFFLTGHASTCDSRPSAQNHVARPITTPSFVQILEINQKTPEKIFHLVAAVSRPACTQATCNFDRRPQLKISRPCTIGDNFPVWTNAPTASITFPAVPPSAHQNHSALVPVWRELYFHEFYQRTLERANRSSPIDPHHSEKLPGHHRTSSTAQENKL